MADPKEVTRSINRRVLVVDDSPAIHADFAKTLAPSLETKETTELDEFERELLGGEAPQRAAIEFHLDFAEQGEIGARKVEAAAKAREPYAMAFVDMRMPPGWDGLRTIKEMWRVDPRLEVVICTAFSDHTWGDIFEALGHCEQLLILKKPFDPVEVKQLAASLTQNGIWRVWPKPASRPAWWIPKAPSTCSVSRTARSWVWWVSR